MITTELLRAAVRALLDISSHTDLGLCIDHCPEHGVQAEILHHRDEDVYSLGVAEAVDVFSAIVAVHAAVAKQQHQWAAEVADLEAHYKMPDATKD